MSNDIEKRVNNNFAEFKDSMFPELDNDLRKLVKSATDFKELCEEEKMKER